MMRLLFGLIASLFYFQNLHATQTSISEVYLGSREGDPASLVENVSTIHGDYTEVEVDVSVALEWSPFNGIKNPIKYKNLRSFHETSTKKIRQRVY